jgi:hypothetical protein
MPFFPLMLSLQAVFFSYCYYFFYLKEQARCCPC